MEAVEGEAGADPSERVSRDESQKFRLRGVRGDPPSIATSSNDVSSWMDAWGDRGEFGCGIRNVVRTGPTRAHSCLLRGGGGVGVPPSSLEGLVSAYRRLLVTLGQLS